MELAGNCVDELCVSPPLGWSLGPNGTAEEFGGMSFLIVCSEDS